jgi:enoyl-CoA hydratase/carnithine racemase
MSSPEQTPASTETASAPVNLVERGSVAEIGLNSGPINLVNRDLLRALNRAIAGLAGRAEVRCVILHGGPARAFCAGSDIREFAPLRSDASEHKILFEDMVLRGLARLPMPTIAALDGPALGGGLELALACDLRVARQGVTLGLTESRLGGLAGSGSLRLTRLVGPGRAKRGPLSNRLAKELVDAAQDLPLDAGLSMSTVSQQRIFDSLDLHEGVAAFFAKRAPEFVGR